LLVLVCWSCSSRSPIRGLGRRVRRTRTIAGKKRAEVVDDDDRSAVRTGHAPRVMTILRATAISVLRLAGRTSIAAAPTPRP